MSKVLTDDNAASSPAQEQAPSLDEIVGSFTGAVRDEYDLRGLNAALALRDKDTTKPDVTADSSPAKPAAPSQEDEAQTETDSGPDETQPKTRQDRNWVQIRKELAVAKAKLEIYESERAVSRSSAPATTVEETALPAGTPKRPEFPDIDQFDSTADWKKAVKQYETEKEKYDDWKLEQRLQRDVESRQAETRHSGWSEQVNAGKSKYKDFEAVAFNEKTPASDTMILRMQGHKNGAEIAYYLGQHQDEASRLAELTDIPGIQTPEQYRQLVRRAETDAKAAKLLARADAIVDLEFQRIAETLSKSPAAPAKPKAPLPKPTSEVSVQSRGSAATDDEAEAVRTGNQEAFEAIRNRKALAKAGV